MAIAVLGLAILAILFYIIPGRYRLYQTSLFDQSEEVPLNPMMGFAPDARNLKDCEDTTLVLIDLDWKDWEPEPGFYDKENLEKTYHISDYQKREVCGVLRFHCKAPEDGQKRDLGDAIRALSDYFSDGVSRRAFARDIGVDEKTVRNLISKGILTTDSNQQISNYVSLCPPFVCFRRLLT